jgi:CRP-like cAMP-binding protein
MLEEFEIAVGNELQDSNLELLELVEAYCLGQLRRYKRGERLYWQGDPAISAFVVKSGKVKTFCISPEGKALTYEILGKGRLAGATAYLLDQAHQSTAEALEETEAYAVPLAELEQLLVNSPSASMAEAAKTGVGQARRPVRPGDRPGHPH